MGLRKELEKMIHNYELSKLREQFRTTDGFERGHHVGVVTVCEKVIQILDDNPKKTKPKLEPAKFYAPVPDCIYRLEQRVTSLEHNQNQMLVERSEGE